MSLIKAGSTQKRRKEEVRFDNLLVLIILTGVIEMNPGPRSKYRLCKKYYKGTDKFVKCEECAKRFNASCTNLGENE